MKDRDVEISCRLCENASLICDEECMLCKKYGVVPKIHACRHFAYDPLKREPPALAIKAPVLEFIDIDN